MVLLVDRVSHTQFVKDRVSMYSPDWPEISYVDLPASVTLVLGIKMCTTVPGMNMFLIYVLGRNEKHFFQ